MRIPRSKQCEILGITRAEYDYTRNSHKAMLDRCTREKSTSFYKYGGQGVVVCKEWVDSFVTFVLDMGVRPQGCTLDRRNNDEGYSKDNCRWASHETQNNNKKNNHNIEIDGVVHTAAQLAKIHNILESTIRHRHNNGRNILQAVRRRKGELCELS